MSATSSSTWQGVRVRAAEWRDWVPETALALAVLCLGLWEAFTAPFPNDGTHDRYVLIAFLLPVAVGLCRHAPAVGLAIIAFIGAIHVEFDQPFMQVELAALVVVFGTARWGRPATAAVGLDASL